MPYIEMLTASILNNLGHATTQVFKMNETFVQGYCNDIKKNPQKSDSNQLFVLKMDF